MDFFGLPADIAGLQRRLADAAEPAARLAALVPLAWYLRQRDTHAAAALADEAEALMADIEGLTPAAAATLSGRIALVRAEARWLAADLDAAERLFGIALDQFATAEDAIGSGDTRLLGALIARDRGAGERRAALLAEAAGSYATAGDALRHRVAESWLANDAAFVDPAAARRRWAQLEAALPGETHPGLIACTLAFLAPAAFQSSEYGAAATLYQRGFEAAFEAGQLRSAIVMGSNVAAAFSNLNDYAAALDWAERMLDLARPTGWPSIIATALIQAADPLRGLGRHEAARSLLSEGLAALKPLENSVIYATAVQYLGELSLALDDDAAALGWFGDAEQRARRLCRDDLVGQNLRGGAVASSRLGRFDSAMAMAEGALAIARRNDDRLHEIDALRAVAGIAEQRGDPAAAVLPTLLAAREVAGRIEGYAPPPELLSDIARHWAASGDFQAAYRAEREAAVAHRQIQSREAERRAVAAHVRLETERAHAEAARLRALANSERQRAETLERANEALALLGEVGREITANLTEEGVYEAVARHVGRLVPTTSLSIYRLDKSGKALVLRFGRENGRKLPDRRVGLDDPTALSARCARTREEIVVSGGNPAVPAAAPVPGTVATRSLMFAPLVAGARLLGVLSIQSTEVDVYGERERSILRTLCAYGAIALANAGAMAELKAAEAELKRHMAVLERLARIDALTNLDNRHSFGVRAEEEIARSRRHARPLGLVVFDIDHFKRVNDTWGHAAGDEVLRRVAAVVRDCVRPEDFLARVGGEEFAVLLPGADVEASRRAAERLRSAIAAATARQGDTTIAVTASFGATVLEPSDNRVDSMMARADAALYRAKELGRDRVCMA